MAGSPQSDRGIISFTHFVDEEFLDVFILVAEKDGAARRKAIATGAACFLVIGFKGAGDIPVDDKTHIGLVDSHTEGIGGNGNSARGIHELVLTFGAGGLLHARVIGGNGAFATNRAKSARDLLDRLPRGAVNDARTGFRIDDRKELFFLCVVSCDIARFVAEVGTVKSGYVNARIIQPQRANDVSTNIFGGSCRESDGRWVAKF